jgi:AcrR family transcriptional regulator
MPVDVLATAQALGEEALRACLLDVAAALLAAEGPGALTMRRIAAESGCSTTVLYKHFGAKEAFADALYREGFARLQRTLDAVPQGDDPVEYLAAVGRAYRENALSEGHFYALMHGPGIPGYVPGEEAKAAARASLDVLREAARTCVVTGLFRADADVEEITDVLWAAAHGVISLERAGHFPDGLGAERFRALTAAAAAAFRAGG